MEATVEIKAEALEVREVRSLLQASGLAFAERRWWLFYGKVFTLTGPKEQVDATVAAVEDMRNRDFWQRQGW